MENLLVVTSRPQQPMARNPIFLFSPTSGDRGI
jgi:hypothetical protein